MSGLLVGVAELAAHLDDPAWRIFDCRHDLAQPEYGAQAYVRGHIPGARFMHLDRDLSGRPDGANGRHPLPDIAVFSDKLSKSGVGPETQVVAYDNEGGSFAARLWWMLRWLGHERVAVLDGGLAAWKRAGLSLDAKIPDAAAGGFVPRPQDGTVDAEYLLSRLGTVPMLIVDARSPERFRGETAGLDPVAGHIPGAVNRHYFDNLDDDGCYFRPAAELRAAFDGLLSGRDPGGVVQQCGSGVTACHNILAMELAGLSGSKLYPGSWSEWCADPGRPVATGTD